MKISIPVALAICLVVSCSVKSESRDIRPPALAGTWYSADSKKLAADIDTLLKKKDGSGMRCAPLLIIVPHAGYMYSGAVAAAAYSVIRQYRYDIIYLVGPSHYSSFSGCAVAEELFFETPLGRAALDRNAISALKKSRNFTAVPGAHDREHCLEIQLPFLQRLFSGTLAGMTIVPVLVGEITPDQAGEIGHELAASVPPGKRPLFIISTDFTHYGPRFDYVPFTVNTPRVFLEKLHGLDRGALDRIIARDMNSFHEYTRRTGITICGRNALLAALSIPLRGATVTLLNYNTSAEITGDYANTVSYASLAICARLEQAGKVLNDGAVLDGKERNFLLKLARDTISARLSGREPEVPDISLIPQSCRVPSGAFVTLKKGNELRGCIGTISGEHPVYRVVMGNSLNAAFHDPRFPPLAAEELDLITIEISVLTPLEPVRSAEEIVVGRDGLMIEQGQYRGLLLPQVPVEWKWDRDEFLVHTCRKAGLHDDAWKRKNTRLFRFRATVFSEDEK